MEYSAINLKEKLNKFSEHWSPKIFAQMNDYHFKLVKFQGDFVWHSHADTDEVFIVLDGAMRIDFRDGKVELRAGEMFVVPRGVEHKPFAERECKIMLIEPAGTINTGDAGGDLTAEDNEDKGSSLLLTLASFLHKQKLGISKGLKPEGLDIRIPLPKKLQVIYLISGS